MTAFSLFVLETPQAEFDLIVQAAMVRGLFWCRIRWMCNGVRRDFQSMSGQDVLSSFVHIECNEYKCAPERDRDEETICKCTLDEKCLDGCLNRMVMIECDHDCLNGKQCQNKRFQNRTRPKVTVRESPGKGYGLFADELIPKDTLVIEYVGEVIEQKEFARRTDLYRKRGIPQSYFMSFGSNRLIDATDRGNLSRFVNHSCYPNCEAQQWIVNGEGKVGLFSIMDIELGMELSFDYRAMPGPEPRKCHCGSEWCRGWM